MATNTGWGVIQQNITVSSSASPTFMLSEVGGNANSGQIWGGSLGSNAGPWGFGFMLPADDVCLRYAGLDSLRVLCVSGANTALQFGTGAQFKYEPYFSNGLALGNGSNGRNIVQGLAAPTSGAHAAGEIVLNNGPTGPGSPFAWFATASGSPGTWTALYAGGGVTCSGTPTSSFAATNGIVTHC